MPRFARGVFPLMLAGAALLAPAAADRALGSYVVGSEPISKKNRVEGPTAFRAGRDIFVLFDG